MGFFLFFFGFLVHVPHTLQLTRQSGVTLACLQTTVALSSLIFYDSSLFRRGQKLLENSLRGISIFHSAAFEAHLLSAAPKTITTINWQRRSVCIFSVPTVHNVDDNTSYSAHNPEHNVTITREAAWTSHSTTRLLSVFESNNDETNRLLYISRVYYALEIILYNRAKGEEKKKKHNSILCCEVIEDVRGFNSSRRAFQRKNCKCSRQHD